METFLRSTTEVTDMEFCGNLMGAQVMAAPSWEQMSSATCAMFVSERANFVRPLPTLRSVAEPV